MTDIDTGDHTQDVAALLAETQRLYAEHDALARKIERREPARQAEIVAALQGQRVAYAAEDSAWDALQDALDTQRANPADPALAAGAIAAEAAFEAARAEAHAARRHADVTIDRHLQASTAETAALIELGEQFRATQDAYFAADWRQAQAARQAERTRTAPVVLDKYAQEVLLRCRWAQAHNDGHPAYCRGRLPVRRVPSSASVGQRTEPPRRRQLDIGRTRRLRRAGPKHATRDRAPRWPDEGNAAAQQHRLDPDAAQQLERRVVTAADGPGRRAPDRM